MVQMLAQSLARRFFSSYRTPVFRVKHGSTAAEIKKAFFLFAMANHPDVSKLDPEVAKQRFIQGSEEYEALMVGAAGRGGASSPGGQRSTTTTWYTRDKGASKHKWGTGGFKWTTNRVDEAELSAAEKQVRRQVKAGDLEGALDTWDKSLGDLHLLLFLLEECRVKEVVPNVKRVLSALHASEV